MPNARCTLSSETTYRGREKEAFSRSSESLSMSASSATSAEVAPPLNPARRHLRRQRWVWLAQFLGVIAIIELPALYAAPEHPPLLALVLHFALLSVVTVVFTLRSTQLIDRQLVQLALAEQRERAAAETVARMEVLQATARAIGHNFNQPLTALYGYVELARLGPLSEITDDDLRRMQAEVMRLAQLVREFQRLTAYETTPYAGGAPMLMIPAAKGDRYPYQHQTNSSNTGQT